MSRNNLSINTEISSSAAPDPYGSAPMDLCDTPLTIPARIKTPVPPAEYEYDSDGNELFHIDLWGDECDNDDNSGMDAAAPPAARHSVPVSPVAATHPVAPAAPHISTEETQVRSLHDRYKQSLTDAIGWLHSHGRRYRALPKRAHYTLPYFVAGLAEWKSGLLGEDETGQAAVATTLLERLGRIEWDLNHGGALERAADDLGALEPHVGAVLAVARPRERTMRRLEKKAAAREGRRAQRQM